MKCLKPKNTDLLVVDIFVHVIILLGILLSFFVLVISKLETKELTGQITNQIDTNLPKLYKDINNSSPNKNEFKTLIKSLNNGGDKSILSVMERYYDKPDATTESENSMPILGALIVLLSLTGGLIAIWAVLKYSCNKCIPLGRIIFENIVLFGCIGIIEILFFNFIASKYVPTLPSYFVNETLESMKRKFTSFSEAS
jgi:hypothetical protein